MPMRNPYHLEMLKYGAEFWNHWRLESQVEEPELAGADLSEVNLVGYNLTGANFYEANLCGANLSDADLSGSNLSMGYLIETNLFGANLSAALLCRANMAKANLFGANFTKTNLSEVNLSGANLSMADFTGANLTKANLSQANLTKAHIKDTVGRLQDNGHKEDSQSVAIFTPAMVHQKPNLITKEMLGRLSTRNKPAPVRAQISIQGHTAFHREKTLFNFVLGVLKTFGLNLTENPKILEGDFCAYLCCQGKGNFPTDKNKEMLAGICGGLTSILEEKDRSPEHKSQRMKALQGLIDAIRSLSNPVTVQIDRVIIHQSYQGNQFGIRVFQVSEALMEEVLGNPQILKSSQLLAKILDD